MQSAVSYMAQPALAGLRVLLGVTAGIAAYKAAELVRRLRDAGAEVRVVMTESAERFITPLTFQALSGYPVRTGLWDDGAEANVVDRYVTRLRRKLGTPPLIRTVRGSGFTLRA